MRRSYWATLAVALLLFNVSVDAQGTKKPSAAQQKKPAAQKEASAPAGYEITAFVLNDKGLSMVVVDPDSERPHEDGFRDFLKDYFGVKPMTPAGAKRALPKVVVKFIPENEMGILINAVKTLQVSEKMVVELEADALPFRLAVPGKIRLGDSAGIKPNPLMLVVTMDDEKNIELNNEPEGRLTDLTALTGFLTKIFHDREVNGVFRENSNEVEKSVFIKMPVKASGGDLIKIAQALKSAGAGPISLQIEDLPDRVEIIATPGPVKKKPNK